MAALERGAAVIDPAGVARTRPRQFGLGRFCSPSDRLIFPLTSGQLFALPSMAPVRRAIDAEFDRYVASHKAGLPGETIGVGSENFDFQLFDRALLYSCDTRFVLAGIVNRMDRAFVSPANCGEIRLIYRLTRIAGPAGARTRFAAAADDAEHRDEG